MVHSYHDVAFEHSLVWQSIDMFSSMVLKTPLSVSHFTASTCSFLCGQAMTRLKELQVPATMIPQSIRAPFVEGDHLCYRLDLHEPISPWQSPVGSRAPDFEVHWKREWHDDTSSWHAISFDVIKGVGHWWLQQSFLSNHNSNDDILKVTVSF